ncbi:MAG: hypothetical protein NT157_06010 [Candidatus Micrarchaeota archaeon]|nr:hypothetical protein [Candidatus Micrarchaeota archaeon]
MLIGTALKWAVIAVISLFVLSIMGVVQSKILEQTPVPENTKKVIDVGQTLESTKNTGGFLSNFLSPETIANNFWFLVVVFFVLLMAGVLKWQTINSWG